MPRALARMVGIAALGAALAPALASGCGRGEGDASPAVSRAIDATACGACHPRALEAWRSSDHARSMAVATKETVLADFRAPFEHFGVATAFSWRAGSPFVRTDGPDGEPRDYPVGFTFGHFPLQQYLIPTERGRLQALSICWDSRPTEVGGQRWFHLYPGEPVPSSDPLHWTGAYQNWNFMCAECHSTNLERRYRPERDSYDTQYSEIHVSCEACHGPGAEHVAWAEAKKKGGPDRPGYALRVAFEDRAAAGWNFEPGATTARRREARPVVQPFETCARCHARRAPLVPTHEAGRPFLDEYVPALLEEPLYHADGQILDEVYEYGSFLQSKMHAAGVSCVDCHDAHTGKAYFRGNELCAKCHLSQVYDTSEHHHHAAGSAGARCADCHMPSRTYMVVDPRRDHSLRVPRPDLTEKIGVPNACGGCHAKEGAAWAREASAKWWGTKRAQEPHWGEALFAGREGAVGCEEKLAALASDPKKPGIARASAIALLERTPRGEFAAALERAAEDPDPLVRMAAARAVRPFPNETKARVARRLVADPILAVRIEAARALAGEAARVLDREGAAAFERALAEYRRAQLANADRAEAHLNLAALAGDLGDPKEAEAECRAALRLAPALPMASVQLADVLREGGRDEEGERVLRASLARNPDHADLRHALGLLLVRRQQSAEALAELAAAARLDPARPRYAYVHGVALHSAGRREEARAVWEQALARHPGDPDLLSSLANDALEAGRRGDAEHYARRLVERLPGEAGARSLLERVAAPR